MAYPSSESTGGASRPTSSITSPQIKSRSRAQSISSDRPSNGGNALMSPPVSISPEAAFIAASAASQIVTNDHDNHANQWYDQHGIEPSGETAMVSVAALQLVNNFLDQLLFGFLSIARSTSLSALRPAVTEVLKPKLAKDAINQADEELREYLGGGDDEDMLQSQKPDSPKDWDLELVWKRTRLRCMVYSSLGDMEEEDEDFFMEQENLDGGDEALGETVSPAVAIFLTSILEFMGEQALTSAGQAAFHRMRFLLEKERKDASAKSATTAVAERITVDEVDMERVAFDRTIGRLWRVWKKRIRSPQTDIHAFQPRTMDMVRTATSLHRDSLDEIAISKAVSDKAEKNLAAPALSERTSSVASFDDVKHNATKEAAAAPAPIIVKNEEEWLAEAVLTPLPAKESDLAELLFPGTAAQSDNEGESSAIKRQRKNRRNDPTRPKSLMIFSPSFMVGLPTPTFSEPRTPEFLVHRKRANSLPTPSTSPYATPSAKRVKPSEEEDKTDNNTDAVEPEAVQTVPEVEVDAGSEAAAESPKSVLAPPLKQRKRPTLPLPLQTAMIGAAITTSSPRAIPVASMKKSGTASQEEGDEIDEFTEEPEIMTSSRVSISGRSNSPTVSESSRPVSMAPGMPVRSPSIHSLRVIEVTSPRSPVARSRNGSSEFNELVGAPRASNASRASSSISSQPIAEESTVVHGPRSSSLGATMSRSQTSQTSQTNESISETEEDANENQPKAAATSPSPPKRFEDMQAQLQSEPPIFGSSARHSPTSPVHPPSSRASPTSRVAIADPATASGTFFLDDKPEVPPKTQPAEITLPERSAKRQAAAVASAAATSAIASTVLRASGPRSEVPPSPSLVTDRSSFSSSREHQARDPIRAQIRADAEAVGRKQSVASIASSISKLVPKRSSEESTAMRPEDVARNFEELIHSDQTIQYTLTPEGMRDIDATRSIHENSGFKSRKSEDVNRQARSRSSSLNNRAEGKRSTSVARPTPLDLRVTEASNSKLSGAAPLSPRSIAPSMMSVSSKPRGSISQAREARVPRESLADFADFIRETGPVGGAAAPAPAIRNNNPPMTGSVSNAVRNMSSSMSMSKTSMDSSKASTFSNRPRYQARDAAVDYKDDNSDLIDFIRRGPPNTNSNPRIPRTVAPFRSTMDSDLMSGAVGGRAVDASIPNVRYSGASTNITDSSMGSGAGLIKKGSAPPKGNMFGMPDGMPNGMPKRKTRRVRDPYAIDLSDEDEEFDDIISPIGGPVTRRPPPPKEESLMDFLNSVPPPSDHRPVPFNIPQARAAQPPAPKKKASAPSLISRFTRHNSISGNHNSRNLQSSSGTHSSSNSIFDARSIASRAGSAFSGRNRNHIPIQVNVASGYDKYGTPIGGVAPPPTSNPIRPAAASSGRVPMKKFEPREAASVPSRATQDLADFFRNSGPAQSFRG